MRLLLATAVLASGLCAFSLAGCQKGSGDQGASERAVEEAGGSVPTMQHPAADAATTTGAAGAATGPADPDPTGAGAMKGATPGDATGSLSSTPTEAPTTTLPTPK